LWLANGATGTVLRMDPHSGKTTRTIRVGGSVSAVAVGEGSVWVAVD
jgi:hypothetical protein